MGALVYKLLRPEEWAAFRSAGWFDGAPVDLADGFIHLSAADQVAETAAKHFAGVEGLVLVAVRVEALGEALRWEPSRGGDLFPHLYARLRMEAVDSVVELPLGEGGRHRFPIEIGG